MKFKVSRYILIIGIVFFSLVSNAQDFTFGIRTGYGNTIYKRQSDELKTEKYFTQKFGLSAEFSPYFSRFFIVSGTDFEFNDFGSSMMIPLGLRITVGNDFRVFIEGGGYYTINLKDKSEEYNLKNDLGVRAGLGMQYRFDRNWMIELAYFGKFGFTPRLEQEIPIPGNEIHYENYTQTFNQIEISVKYRL